jgi:hypothetical protein
VTAPVVSEFEHVEAFAEQIAQSYGIDRYWSLYVPTGLNTHAENVEFLGELTAMLHAFGKKHAPVEIAVEPTGRGLLFLADSPALIAEIRDTILSVCGRETRSRASTGGELRR